VKRHLHHSHTLTASSMTCTPLIASSIAGTRAKEYAALDANIREWLRSGRVCGSTQPSMCIAMRMPAASVGEENH
jgi:hypothetical protein